MSLMLLFTRFYIIDTEISSRKKVNVKKVGNANDENSPVKKRRSFNHKRERRKLQVTSEQHRVAI